MNTANFHREGHNKMHPYSTISNKLLRDTRLNITAIGLMTYILSNSDDHQINLTYIKKRCMISKKQFTVAWILLQQYQYVIIKYEGNHKWHYIINEAGDKMTKSKTPPVDTCKTPPVDNIRSTIL